MRAVIVDKSHRIHTERDSREAKKERERERKQKYY